MTCNQIVAIYGRIKNGTASFEDRKAFASLCGEGLRDWRDFLTNARRRRQLGAGSCGLGQLIANRKDAK